jgi:hypothetical protein
VLVRALIAALALSGCVVHEEVRIAGAPCAVEPLAAPPAVFVSEDPAPQPMPSRARSISLGYIGDNPLTPSVPSGSGSGHAWQDYMRRGSWRGYAGR